MLRIAGRGRCASIAVLLWPYLPDERPSELLAALGAPGPVARGRARSAPGRLEQVEPLEPLFPKDRGERELESGEGTAA